MSANFGFAYWDENGTNRAEMDELGISYYDENETVRVAITNAASSTLTRTAPTASR